MRTDRLGRLNSRIRTPALATASVVFLLLISGAGSAAGASFTPTYTHCNLDTSYGFPAYDPVNRAVYIPNPSDSNITVLRGNCTVLGVIGLRHGGSARAAAFDPANNRTYVTVDDSNGSSQVLEISGLRVTHTIWNGSLRGANELAYDPADRSMLVAAEGNGELVGIQGHTVTGSVSLGGAWGVGFDPSFDEILVTNPAGDNVTLVNASDPFGGPHLQLKGVTGYNVVYDPRDGYDYISNQLGRVYVVAGNASLVGTVSVGTAYAYTDGITWDSRKAAICVANLDGYNVTLIRGLRVVGVITLPLSSDPYGMAYDASDSRVYVVNPANRGVYILA
jgi:DNA-binding beta-propeller fold protein YncE